MKKIILQYLALGCLLITVFSSCRKESFGGKENSQAGKTYVWTAEAPEVDQFFDVFTNVKPIKMFIVRRDPANKADLQKAVTVTLTALDQKKLDVLTDTAGYTDIWTTNIYTLPTAADIATGGLFLGSEGITKTATGLTVNFAPGEFAKNIIFMVDGSKVDLSAKYGVAFQITDFGGFTKKVGYDVVVSTVGIKNKWDGVYKVTGSYTDASLPAATGAYPYVVEFQTISATAVDVYNRTFSGYEFAFNLNDGSGNQSAYGSFAPEFTFDPTTNALVLGVNAYGQGSGAHARSLNLDPTGANVYDPSAKTLTVKYVMISDGTTRCKFDEVYTYTGSR